MYFPTKKDIWFYLIIWGCMLLMILPLFFGSGSAGVQFISADSPVSILLIIIMIAFLAWIWFGTGYRIEEATIKIRFAPFKWTIPIEDIQSIRKVKNPISAPALSIDRLEITYGKYKVMSISPKNEIEFLQLLMNENPRIKLDERLSESLNFTDSYNMEEFE